MSTTVVATQIASNTSAFFAKTEATPGTAPSLAGTNAIRLVGTPTFKLRGPAIVAERNSMTPFGGGLTTVTAGRGWDVSFETEFPIISNDPSELNGNPLAPLFRACMLKLTEVPNTSWQLAANAGFSISAARANAWDVQPVTLQFQETNGKTYTATGCVGTFKINAPKGDIIKLQWSFKGLYTDPVDTGAGLTPNYGSWGSNVLVNTDVTLARVMSNDGALFSLSDWTFDPGIELHDWATGQTYANGIATGATNGFAIGGSTLAKHATLEMTVASVTETTDPTWADASNNVQATTTLVAKVGTDYTLTIDLQNAVELAYPDVGETDGYRSQKLMIGAVHANSGTTPAFTMTWADV